MQQIIVHRIDAFRLGQEHIRPDLTRDPLTGQMNQVHPKSNDEIPEIPVGGGGGAITFPCKGALMSNF